MPFMLGVSVPDGRGSVEVLDTVVVLVLVLNVIDEEDVEVEDGGGEYIGVVLVVGTVMLVELDDGGGDGEADAEVEDDKG
jgi:hypothetical protein